MRHNKKDCCESDCKDKEKIRDSVQIAWERTAVEAVLFFEQTMSNSGYDEIC